MIIVISSIKICLFTTFIPERQLDVFIGVYLVAMNYIYLIYLTEYK